MSRRADAFSYRPLLAAFITLIVIAGGLLARVWIAAHVAAQRLVSPQELSSTLDLTSGVPKIALTEYRLSRRLLWLALTAMSLAGSLYILSVWWWALTA